MVKSISAKYGPATIVAPEIDAVPNERYHSTQKPVASWEDAQYSFSLVRSSYNDVGASRFFEASQCTSRACECGSGDTRRARGPKREAERQKKQMDDLEVARQKNQKSFHP